MTAFDLEAVLRFRELVTARLGLHFRDDHLDQLRDVLSTMAGEATGGASGYMARIAAAAPDAPELRALASALTVSETYFFRNLDQFRALEERVLPECAAAAARRPLRILSAGCASGEEPYSIAIVARELEAGGVIHGAEITGIDVSTQALAKARRAHYTAWALRGTPERIRGEYFQRRGRDFVLRSDIAGAVRFEERNLARADRDFWRPAIFDVVFFRNTFMYFAPDVAAATIARIAQALVPGGYLFIGHAETLRGLSDAFELQHSHETFYYRRRDATSRPMPSHAVRKQTAIPAAIDRLTDDSWFHAIGAASSRVTELVEEALTRPTPPSAGPEPPSRHPTHASALALLGEERYAEALVHVDSTAAEDADALLLRAVLLTNLGRFEHAADACHAVLQADPLSSGAHYLLALHARHAGDLVRARRHDEAAIYLDGDFAMPHLHLGLLARSLGDFHTAHHHLAQAIQRLRREDSARLLLFGGGFTREALLQLCEAELKRVSPTGGRSGH